MNKKVLELSLNWYTKTKTWKEGCSLHQTGDWSKYTFLLQKVF